MKKVFLKYFILVVCLIVSIQAGSCIGFSSSLDDILKSEDISLDTDKENIVSDIDGLISSYAGHYKGDRELFVSESKKILIDKELRDKFEDIFSDISLDIYENGTGLINTVIEIGSYKIKTELGIEIVDVTETTISFKLKNGETDDIAVFSRNEDYGQEYLFVKRSGFEYYFKKV